MQKKEERRQSKHVSRTPSTESMASVMEPKSLGQPEFQFDSDSRQLAGAFAALMQKKESERALRRNSLQKPGGQSAGLMEPTKLGQPELQFDSHSRQLASMFADHVQKQEE